jgi:hypothetical protein
MLLLSGHSSILLRAASGNDLGADLYTVVAQHTLVKGDSLLVGGVGH